MTTVVCLDHDNVFLYCPSVLLRRAARAEGVHLRLGEIDVRIDRHCESDHINGPANHSMYSIDLDALLRMIKNIIIVCSILFLPAEGMFCCQN